MMDTPKFVETLMKCVLATLQREFFINLYFRIFMIFQKFMFKKITFFRTFRQIQIFKNQNLYKTIYRVAEALSFNKYSMFEKNPKLSF